MYKFFLKCTYARIINEWLEALRHVHDVKLIFIAKCILFSTERYYAQDVMNVYVHVFNLHVSKAECIKMYMSLYVYKIFRNGIVTFAFLIIVTEHL